MEAMSQEAEVIAMSPWFQDSETVKVRAVIRESPDGYNVDHESKPDNATGCYYFGRYYPKSRDTARTDAINMFMVKIKSIFGLP